ncbi:MAG TPA: AMP-binding protein, partial [Blastocatellia bacterium]|nr:AMP-binding protein [Blastocatellia bacterium]
MKVSSASRPQEDRTFVELLRRRASEHPMRLACSYLGDGEAERSSLTYGELDRRARAIGAQLAALDAAGERVLLLYPSGLEFIAAFIGCLYAGAVAVPAYPPRVRRHMSRLQTNLADARASVALTAASVLSRLEPFIRDNEQIRALRWIATDTLAGELAEEWREPEIDPSTLAFLQYTSGSTAAPKGVMVSHSNLLCNERLIQSAFRQTDESI